MYTAAECSWSFVYCVITLCIVLLLCVLCYYFVYCVITLCAFFFTHVFCFTMYVAVLHTLVAGCWLEVSIRKVLRPATSAQVFLSFPVSISEC
jgi:hypothetical protein